MSNSISDEFPVLPSQTTTNEDYYDISGFIGKRTGDFVRTQGRLKRAINAVNDDLLDVRKTNAVIRETNMLQKKRDTQQYDPTALFTGSDQTSIRNQL
jgi:hypothetical protein